ncbi:MAG: hypothetical protein HY865_00855 [Chloroflexi bacterium]|nr:hypothetical protein [Chloroflexota bacterium]
MKREYYYYAAVGAAVLLNELGIKYGPACITYPIALFLILWAALKYLSKDEQ